MKMLSNRDVLNRLIAGVTLSVVVFGAGGCSTKKEPEPLVVSLEETTEREIIPAKAPPGVVRYCWEEPMVSREHNGPGLNTEGTWYSPSYSAVRQVRGGKWRPCDPIEAASDGGTK